MILTPEVTESSTTLIILMSDMYHVLTIPSSEPTSTHTKDNASAYKHQKLSNISNNTLFIYLFEKKQQCPLKFNQVK